MYFFDLVQYTDTTRVTNCKNIIDGNDFIGFIFKTDGSIKGFTASNVPPTSQYYPHSNQYYYRPYISPSSFGFHTEVGLPITHTTPTYSGDSLSQICCSRLAIRYPNYNIQWINNECRWFEPCAVK